MKAHTAHYLSRQTDGEALSNLQYMLEILISSKTRIKLLMKFFINVNMRAYLRGLEQEFGESSNAIRVELNRLEKAGMLTSEAEGNKKYFQANKEHPLFDEIRAILLKHVGINQIMENVIERLGNVKKVFLVGSFAQGMDSTIIDLILVGDIDKSYLFKLSEKVETLINRKIRTIVYSQQEYNEMDKDKLPVAPILLWDRKTS